MSIQISEKICKSALSPSGIYGWKYVINPYSGCEHGCKYCYAPNIIRQPRITWGTYVEVKKNIPTILAKQLKDRKPALVGISSVTDPYQRIEEQYLLTRYCLEQLLRYKFTISIITKSPLILRDLDLILKFNYSEVTISITTMDEQIANILEPQAPTIAKRLEALKKLSDAGVNTYAFIGPILPTLEPEQVEGFIHRLVKTGVKTVMVDTLNLKAGIWENIKNALYGHNEIRKKIHNRLFQDKNYYNDIITHIKSQCKNHNIKFE